MLPNEAPPALRSQRTLRSPVEYRGVGLHSGKEIKVAVRPAEAGATAALRTRRQAAEPLTAAGFWDPLRERFEVDEDETSDLAAIIGGYDAIVIRSATKLTAELIDQGTNLKVIGRAGVGVDNVDVPAATGATLTLNSLPLSESGASYTVAVSNGVGAAVLSAAAVITVTEAPYAPVITLQPAAVAVGSGSKATFTVAARANPAPVFQWRKGSTALPGETNTSFSIAAAGPADAGDYDVVVSNGQGDRKSTRLNSSHRT